MKNGIILNRVSILSQGNLHQGKGKVKTSNDRIIHSNSIKITKISKMDTQNGIPINSSKAHMCQGQNQNQDLYKNV